jgi:hypothetical protein
MPRLGAETFRGPASCLRLIGSGLDLQGCAGLAGLSWLER